MSNLIIHIPHASTEIPSALRESFLLSREELAQELLFMTDAFTDELFACEAPAISVAAPVSRLVVDVERFRDDVEEIMSSRGMGAIYETTSHGQRFRAPLSAAERERWLAAWYDPHHAALSDVVRRGLDRRGQVLIIDAHSFPSSPLPYELDQNPVRPDICLGKDVHHTPAALVERVQGYFARSGFSVEINRPFSGAIVPQPYYLNALEVASLMIEVNRGLYMNEHTGAKNSKFPEIRGLIHNLLNDLIEFSY